MASNERPSLADTQRPPSHFIDGQEENQIPKYPPSQRVKDGKPYIESMEHYKKEWEESVGPNSDQWWAKVGQRRMRPRSCCGH